MSIKFNETFYMYIDVKSSIVELTIVFYKLWTSHTNHSWTRCIAVHYVSFVEWLSAQTELTILGINVTYQQQWAPGLQTQLLARVSLLPSHWRTCWRSHHRLRLSCHWASVRQAGCRVLGNTAPSRRCPSGLRPGRHGWKYTHAGIDK